MEQTVRIYTGESTAEEINEMVAAGWEIVRFTQSVGQSPYLTITVLFQRKVKHPANAIDKVLT